MIHDLSLQKFVSCLARAPACAVAVSGEANGLMHETKSINISVECFLQWKTIQSRRKTKTVVMWFFMWTLNKDKEADCLIIDITKERYLDQYVYSVCFYSSSICIYLV